MIIFGHPIHRKYTNIICKTFVVIVCVLVSVFLVACSKIEFDPTTTSLKYIFSQETKWKP